MSRYIDADAVTQSYQRLCSMITCTECPMYNGDGNECEIYLRVKNTPHIDIVRCKECKWASPNKEGDYDCKFHIPIFRVDAEGYCYLADRKESE